jgi:glycosyltransferase involved in cell wall biosynthesis
MDPDYLAAARAARRRSITTVGGSDEFNRGGVRPIVKQVLRRSLYGRYFDLLWVPGPPQQRWAAKIGYRDRTIPNLLSGDAELFATARRGEVPLAERNQFLFVGRAAKAKAVDVLLEAFCGSAELQRAGRQLTLIGAEASEYGAAGRDQVICRPFLPQKELVDWVRGARAFVLPSRWEPWGVVVHEMACAGLPLILSDHVGSAEQFLVPGANGHLVPADDVMALRGAMETLSRADGSTLEAMATQSIEASASCSPELSAAALMEALNAKPGDDVASIERTEPEAEPNPS